jgi:hypothetical protein
MAFSAQQQPFSSRSAYGAPVPRSGNNPSGTEPKQLPDRSSFAPSATNPLPFGSAGPSSSFPRHQLRGFGGVSQSQQQQPQQQQQHPGDYGSVGGQVTAQGSGGIPQPAAQAGIAGAGGQGQDNHPLNRLTEEQREEINEAVSTYTYTYTIEPDPPKLRERKD